MRVRSLCKVKLRHNFRVIVEVTDSGVDSGERVSCVKKIGKTLMVKSHAFKDITSYFSIHMKMVWRRTSVMEKTHARWAEAAILQTVHTYHFFHSDTSVNASHDE